MNYWVKCGHETWMRSQDTLHMPLTSRPNIVMGHLGHEIPSSSFLFITQWLVHDAALSCISFLLFTPYLLFFTVYLFVWLITDDSYNTLYNISILHPPPLSPVGLPPDSAGLHQTLTDSSGVWWGLVGLRWDSGGTLWVKSRCHIRWSPVGLRQDSGGTLVGLWWIFVQGEYKHESNQDVTCCHRFEICHSKIELFTS
jgi:hypothetical protein